jgi:hypothetical protein
MAILIWSAVSGWAAWFSLLRGAIYPFEEKGVQGRKPYIARIQPHYWISFLSLAAALAHAKIALAIPRLGGTNKTGLWIAAVALAMMLTQAAMGFILQHPFPGRRHVRRVHFWFCIALIPMLAAHIALN